ncbi:MULTISPECIES: zinc ribbon domain-containing protein [Methanobacterium]
MEYVETSESYTSQECSQCGIIGKTNLKYRDCMFVKIAEMF